MKRMKEYFPYFLLLAFGVFLTIYNVSNYEKLEEKRSSIGKKESFFQSLEAEDRFIITKIKADSGNEGYIYKDKKTGVEYLRLFGNGSSTMTKLEKE